MAGVLAGLVLVAAGAAGRAAGRGEAPGETRTLVVAADGTGQFRSLQEAIDEARRGETITIKAGSYAEDVTIHSKQRLKLVGEGMERVTILGRERVGVFHIGKWPYGATDVEISGLTINEHGGHALGIFNGKGIVLREVRINGMVFGQQVQDVRIERCNIGGSETAGVQFADSHATLTGNLIHDNDHGVTIAGKSVVRLERNVITRNLFDGVVVADSARAVLTGNTIAKNGRGASFLGTSGSEVSGNIVAWNTMGFIIAPASTVRTAYNAMFNPGGNFLRAAAVDVPAPELKGKSDLIADPRFVDPEQGDFRLRSDTPLRRVGKFPHLGALAPLNGSP